MENNSRDIQLEQAIDAYLKGKLSEQEVEELWVELLQKPEYIALLETEIDVKRVYKAKQQQDTSTNTYWKWIAAAAAIAILVISINVLSDNTPKPIEEWTKAEITLSENLASAEVTRSATKISSSDSLLNAGFKAAIEGDTNQAIGIYKNIINRYNDTGIISKAYLNLGIIQYNFGEYSYGIESFKKAITIAQDNPLLKEQSYWYMGNAFINIDQLEEARTAVRQAHSLGQIYKDEAFKLLKRLDYELGYIDADNFERQIQQGE